MPSGSMSDVDPPSDVWDEATDGSMPQLNVENDALLKQINELKEENARIDGEYNGLEERYRAMQDHSKSVRMELKNTQDLLRAKRKEIESEEHMRKVGEREEGRLKQETLKLEKNWGELKEERNKHENVVFKLTKTLEDMKSQMNWDQQALEAWLEESARKDEDAMVLAKYTRMDEAKVKELAMTIEKLTSESAKKRHLLQTETTDTVTAQIELDKTAEEFRKSHAERGELILQWEQTIEQMQRRDREMNELAEYLVRMKGEVSKLEEVINTKQRFLDGQLNSNQEMLKKINLKERAAGKIRDDWRDAETKRDQDQSVLDTLKRTVDRTASDLEKTRATVNNLKKEYNEMGQKLKRAKQENDVLQEKFMDVSESKLSAEERMARMEELLAEEETYKREIDQELKRLREQKFKKQEELHSAQAQEKATEVEIDSGQAAMRNLNSKITKLDHDSLKQQEILYNQDFTIQQLERRISRMGGEQSNEDKMALEEKIRQLNEQYNQKQHKHQLLADQQKRLQDDVRRVKRNLEKTKDEKEKLTSKIEEVNLHNDSSERQKAKQLVEKHQIEVDATLLRLQLKDLRDMLNSKADEVLTLEKRRQQVDTAMRERREEIRVHREMLQQQLKTVETERSMYSRELYDRKNMISIHKKKYDSMITMMAPPEGEEERSQAFYVIKAAQEKEELQREGDTLDAKIKSLRDEIRAIQGSLQLQKRDNEKNRSKHLKVSETSDEMVIKDQLEEQKKALTDKLKYKRRQIKELHEDLNTMYNTLSQLERDEGAYGELISEREARIMALKAEIQDQETKIERSAKLNAKLQREVRASAKAKAELPEEVDINIRELREMNKNAVKCLSEAAQEFPETAPSIQLYCQQEKLDLPSPGPGGSRTSSRQSTARSSLNSSRSSHSSVGGGGSKVAGRVSSTGAKQTVSMGAAGFGLTGSPMGSARSSASSSSSKRGGRQ